MREHPFDKLTVEQRELLDDIDGGDAELDALLASFPEDERAEAAAGVYFDADGTPRTHYQRLRSV